MVIFIKQNESHLHHTSNCCLFRRIFDQNMCLKNNLPACQTCSPPANSIARILMNVSRIVSLTECAWAWDILLRFRTSALRSFAFFCRPRSWLYISGVSWRSRYMWRPSYCPDDKVAGFGGGAGFSLSLSILRKQHYFSTGDTRGLYLSYCL